MNTRTSPVDTPTPRTDAAFDALSHDRQFAVMACGFSDHARQLERELSASAERERRLVEASRYALEHVLELREAWVRGAISEHDGHSGMRSNRNVEVEQRLRAALKEQP